MEITYSRNDRILRRKFYQYLIPTVLMVMAMQFGSLADAIIMGNMLGSDALSAASLCLPIIFLSQVPGFCLAVGASIIGANLLGKRDTDNAGKVFKISLLLAFLIGFIFLPIGIFFGDNIASLLAGNFTELVPLVRQYLQVYLYQSPIVCAGLVISYFLASDNCPTMGAVYFIVANVVHLIALVLFSFFLPRDVVMYGAASSMGIGMLAGFIVLPFYVHSKRRCANLKAPLKGAFSFLPSILKSGSASAVFALLSAVFYFVISLGATNFLSDKEMPIYAMLSNLSFLVDLCIIGVLQVMPALISALFGEKDYFGIRSIYRRVMVISISVSLLLMVISLIFPQLFFWIFGVDLASITDGFVSPYGNDPLLVLRIYVISFAFYTVNRAFATYYPSILVNSPGVFANIIRSGVIGPALIYVLMMSIGALGYAIGNVVMEAATVALTIGFVLLGNKIGKLPGKGLLLLPSSSPDERCMDISLPTVATDMERAVEQIQRFATDLSGEEKSGALLAVACEEILSNIISYGYKRNVAAQYVDINLRKNEDSLVVRIRDDGVAFDPTAFDASEEEEYRFHGIEVVRSIASDFRYLRVMNMNNTIIEVQLNAA